MLIKTRTLDVKTKKVHDYVDITERIKNVIKDAEIKTGIANIFCKHTTSAVVIQEKNKDVHKDTEEVLKRLLPLDANYHHSEEGPINAAAHVKNQILGPSITVPIRKGKMELGVWQRIFFIELFEPRNRKIEVTILGSPTEE